MLKLLGVALMIDKSKILIVFFVAAIFCLPKPASAQMPRFFDYNEWRQLDTTEEQIKALNLINGLYLSESQMKSILDVLYELRGLNDNFEELAAQQKDRLEKTYSNLKADLMDDDMADEKNERAVMEQKVRLDQLTMDYRKKRADLQEELNGVFTDKQLRIIQDYKPCLVPPKTDANTSIGQAGDSDLQSIERLEKLRKLPRDEFSRVVSDTIARAINYIETHDGLYHIAQRRDEITRLAGLAWDIYEMDEVDFQMRKSELAEEMKPRLPEPVDERKAGKEAREKKSKKSGSPEIIRKYDLDKVGQIFLNEDLIEVFEYKIYSAS
jgi:hypothetical protein